MTTQLHQLFAVNGSLICLVILPFIPVSYAVTGRGCWSRTVLIALLIGVSLQSVLGIFWTHLIADYPTAELLLYALGWFVSLCFTVYLTKQKTAYKVERTCLSFSEWQLLVICLCAFIIRSIHPLEVAYLGQSDGYTHLNYLQNIVEQAKLVNPVYPAGFHWILALPAFVFSIDPYLIARFGGAIFGVGLVLGIYVLLDVLFSRRTALFGSFCAACFPLMTLLMKTGVGVFANQCGLMLLPPIFMFYADIVSGKNAVRFNLLFLVIALLGLVATVPMMLLHVLVIFSFERVLAIFSSSGTNRWGAITGKILLLLLPAIVLLGFQTMHLAAGHRFETTKILVKNDKKIEATVKNISSKMHDFSKPEQSSTFKKVQNFVKNSQYVRLVLDYLDIKRKNGFGNHFLNTVGLLFGMSFFYLMFLGYVRGNYGYVILGLWGVITLVQAMIGFLQFSAYQREGWSLLIAVCCLTGIIAASLYIMAGQYMPVKITVVGILAAVFIWGVFSPPGHPQIRSSAENDVIKTVRFLGMSGAEQMKSCMKKAKSELCGAMEILDEEKPLVLVNRRFSGWGNQGEVVKNVLQRDSRINSKSLGNRINSFAFRAPRQYVVLIDGKNKITASQRHSAFAMVTPQIVDATLKHQKHLYKVNKKIIALVKNLDPTNWTVQKFTVSDKLKGYVIVPIDSGVSLN